MASTTTTPTSNTVDVISKGPILSLLQTCYTSPPQPPSELTLIKPTLQIHLKELRTLNTLLLQVPYPDKFYKEILDDSDGVGKVSRLAYWAGERVCVGGVRGRVEEVEGEGQVDEKLSTLISAEQGKEKGKGTGTRNGKRLVKIYILSIGVRAPFRGMGVGRVLMEWICNGGELDTEKDVEVVEVYAHVWEMNLEALEWYRRRGFMIGEEVVEGYYRRLKPGGARIVRWFPLGKRR